MKTGPTREEVDRQALLKAAAYVQQAATLLEVRQLWGLADDLRAQARRLVEAADKAVPDW